MVDTATTTESDSGPLQTALTEEPLANDATTQPDEPDTGDACPAAPPRPRKRAPISPVRAAGLFGAAVIVALATVVGWLGWGEYQSVRSEQQRHLLLAVGRQEALNLTTIDWRHPEDDVQRILDSATGEFHDEFAARAPDFVDMVKEAQSTTVGTVTEAGIESVNGAEAQLLVAVTVKVNTAGVEQDSRAWRMRISVSKTGDDAKVSKVQFVP